MTITFTATDGADFEPGVYRAKLKELETAEISIVDEKTGQPGFYTCGPSSFSMKATRVTPCVGIRR